MSMTIQIESSNYRIRLSGDRRRFIARNGIELVEAVRHHFNLGHTGVTGYPICRAVQAQSGSRRKVNSGIVRRRCVKRSTL